MTEDEVIQRASIPYAYRLAYLINWYREPLLKRIEDDLSVSRSEWIVLWVLSMQEGIISRDISELTGQARNSISRAVISLDRRGFIERRPHEKDGRASSLYMTESGDEVFRQVMPLFEERETSLLSGLDVAERKKFMHLLEKLCSHVPNWKDI
ncbi:MAG: MarR family winged helix-turn-helix transcriptional regulator [Pseudomonadota bacterium]